jgi:CheY-like chemotaxis protein
VTILLIEDELLLQRLLTRYLEEMGHAVLVAANGREALRLFKMAPPDLVITDIMLPEMSGIEVILMLRARAPDLPIVAMSGGDYSGSLDLLGTAQLVGRVTLLPKPFLGADLSAAISSAMMGRRRGGDVANGGAA